ncbi:uncharacterized protein [Typha latifolia]|uniref:uncharacterized protein isoform X3 n=1 Tax=Typha latifolia TaxID=4733 RepID=UPI003C2EBE4D
MARFWICNTGRIVGASIMHGPLVRREMRYYSSLWIQEDPNRVPPDKDLEISNMRNKCLKRLFLNAEEQKMAYQEYTSFSTSTKSFAEYDSIADRNEFDPNIWWAAHGASAPILQNLALRLLGQPCSSSGCERNWSTYSFIHSLKRNKITPQRAEDLVYVHTNFRLLSRMFPNYLREETKMWDVGGDSYDSFNSAGMLEFADLSIDELNLETIMLVDEGNEAVEDE